MGKVNKSKPGIRKRLLRLHLFIITLTVVLFESIFFIGIYQYYYRNTEDVISSHAQSSANFAMKFSDLSPYNLKNSLPDMIREFKMQGAEMQIVLPSGKVLASSTGFLPEHNIEENILNTASIDQPSVWKGKNPGTDERIMAAVVPLNYDGQTIIYFRYVISLSNIDHLVQKIITIALAIGVSIIFVVLLLSKALATKITTPLTQITEASKRFAKGDFDSSINESYIGELGTLAKSFNDMCNALLQHEKLKDQFVSSISHELRTPLTSIKGWSETLLVGSLNNPDEMKTGMKIISRETERLIILVEELLDFSRMNNEAFHIEPNKFHVENLIKEVAEQLEKQLKKKQIELGIHVSDYIDLIADRNRIKQVLINLLDNAIKFSSPEGKIIISCYLSGNHCMIEVKDNGAGIKNTDLPNISNPFYKPNQQTTGVGLGLAICKHIIDLHHGRLEIDSTFGQGTKVTISIPMS
ncbi:cell wall metabolism sensor histidine kinase WalK [Paucisalibacillus sp. EB02]|uniref:sensor histidine kinase n=1 Tax=Paucisalibacillus sp. EB02 TaxID=1347087 RepID=UPI000693AABF|nr:HAMP domain-containing sensor histidine kinase [Paucisalibacillus sp. EB02]